ncbi:MAG: L,D-transpeptidase [Xanthobacteraceae bacterium]
MQRIARLSLALASTLTVTSTALAGPLSLNSQRAPAPSMASIYDTSWQPAPPPRPAAARGEYGGGFIEYLFSGPAGSRDDQRYDSSSGYRRYPQMPGDVGPGMVESPYQPGQPVLDPRYVKQEVAYQGDESPGTVIVNTRDRFLYLVQDGGRAVRYGIGVGRPGFTWAGVHHVTQKREWPDWTPPDEMLKRRPDLPRHMVGGPDNPLGARALYLGSTLYRIHGSNEPWTIGTQVSSGCIRMRNEDVIDLYGRVKLGSKVVVI